MDGLGSMTTKGGLLMYECFILFSARVPRALDVWISGWVSGVDWGVRVALHGLGARAMFSDRRGGKGIFIMGGAIGGFALVW